MERLTMWHDGNHAICTNEDCTSDSCPFADAPCEHVQEVIDRLAAYEDMGLEPEDFKKAFNEHAVVKLAAQALGTTPDRLRELVEADNEWRVLPEKSMWTATCHGSKLVLILDVKAAQEAEAALGGGEDG